MADGLDTDVVMNPVDVSECKASDSLQAPWHSTKTGDDGSCHMDYRHSPAAMQAAENVSESDDCIEDDEHDSESDESAGEDKSVMIPLRDKHRRVVAYTRVDKADYDAFGLSKYTISRRPTASGKHYACLRRQEKVICLHRLLLQPIKPGCTVDHLNLNTLDNRRRNLRQATVAQQNQNRSKRSGASCRYKGVRKKGERMWDAKCGDTWLGCFYTAEEAAKAYDKFAIHWYGVRARTNNMLTDEEILKAVRTPPEVFRRRAEDLPKGVIRRENGRYQVRINSKVHGTFATAQEAITVAEGVRQQHADAKAKALLEKKITRDEHGVAYVLTNTSGRAGIASSFRILVDDGDWHVVMKKLWSKSSPSHYASTSHPSIQMHQFIWQHHHGSLPLHPLTLHHKNMNIDDNRLGNLTTASPSVQAHAQRKRKNHDSSEYFGVSYVTETGHWRAEIRHDGDRHQLGTYELEIDAAKATNMKAVHLYEDEARLNVFPPGTDMTIVSRLADKHAAKPILQCDAVTGDVLRTFRSRNSAARSVNVHSYRLSDHLRAHSDKPFAGFLWRPIDDVAASVGDHVGPSDDALSNGDVSNRRDGLDVPCTQVIASSDGLALQHAHVAKPSVSLDQAWIEQRDATTGDLITRFLSVITAAKAVGGLYASLCDILLDTSGSSVYCGYRWRVGSIRESDRWPPAILLQHPERDETDACNDGHIDVRQGDK
jgi:hypothetical protein